jgi:hypothetical protein
MSGENKEVGMSLLAAMQFQDTVRAYKYLKLNSI